MESVISRRTRKISQPGPPVRSEELALERWEDDGGRVVSHPDFETVPPPGRGGNPDETETSSGAFADDGLDFDSMDCVFANHGRRDPCRSLDRVSGNHPEANGRRVEEAGNPVDVSLHPERAAGHVTTGGTFDMLYNPILSDRPVKRD